MVLPKLIEALKSKIERQEKALQSTRAQLMELEQLLSNQQPLPLPSGGKGK